MSSGSTTHIIFLLITIAYYVASCLIIRKLPEKVQNIIFIVIAFLCASGIFYRYGLNYFKGFTPKTLGMQMLQVCNFNMILVALMLVPKFELARQYSFMFSMFAAATALLSISSSWKNLAWSDPIIMNSWLNHTFAISLPLLMLSTGRFRPQKKYIWPVVACFVLYFTVSFLIQKILINNEILNINNSYSFIFRTEGVGLLDYLYKLIPHAYFYLLPILPLFIGWCYGLVYLWKLFDLIKKKKNNVEEE